MTNLPRVDSSRRQNESVRRLVAVGNSGRTASSVMGRRRSLGHRADVGCVLVA